MLVGYTLYYYELGGIKAVVINACIKGECIVLSEVNGMWQVIMTHIRVGNVMDGMFAVLYNTWKIYWGGKGVSCSCFEGGKHIC